MYMKNPIHASSPTLLRRTADLVNRPRPAVEAAVLPALAIPAIGLKEDRVDTHLVDLQAGPFFGTEMLASIAVPCVGTRYIFADGEVDFGGWSRSCARTRLDDG